MTRRYVPRTDIYETDSHLVLVAEMPGVDEKSIDITVDRNVLSVHGKVNGESFEGKNLAYAEYNVGDYERSFSLPDEIDRNKIDASLKHGLLHLRLPKADSAKVKKIPVKTG